MYSVECPPIGSDAMVALHPARYLFSVLEIYGIAYAPNVVAELEEMFFNDRKDTKCFKVD